MELVIAGSMRTIENTTEERMIEADGVTFPVLTQNNFGLIVVHRVVALCGQVMCYDPERGEFPINYQENLLYEKMQAV